MPAELLPELATPSSGPPSGGGWLHEIKFDGYRMLAFCSGGTATLRTRRGHDWTSRLSDLSAEIASRVGGVDCVIDGEAVVLDARGATDFQALQSAIQSGQKGALSFIGFDLPWCAGFDLSASPVEVRREVLAALLGSDQTSRVRYSEHVLGDGRVVYEKACALGLEGIVSKRLGSPYLAGRRSPDWLKSRRVRRQELVVGGFTPPEGARAGIGALAVGHYEKGRLVYAGKVGTGFTAALLDALAKRLTKLSTPSSPFASVPRDAGLSAVTWVRPELVAEVEFKEWTRGGTLRHAAFRGLREDKSPREIAREVEPALPEVTAGKVPAKAPRPLPVKPRVPAVRLTSPERVVFPDRGAGYAVTKRELAAYYEAVAGWMLPHVAGRPLAIVRCPSGEGGPCFFQKHKTAGLPAGVQVIELEEADGELRECLVIKDARGLVGLAQMNALEIHPWGSRVDRPERPDRFVMDLDPGPDVKWIEVVEAARLMRGALKQAGLTGFARSTGGKGLHVVAPLTRRHTWEQVKGFGRLLAESFEKLSPKRFVAVSTKSRREGRIYVDYLRNGRGATAVASYSTRARPGGPVALPLAWDELEDFVPTSATVFSVPERLAGLREDPWAGLATAGRALPAIGLPAAAEKKRGGKAA